MPEESKSFPDRKPLDPSEIKVLQESLTAEFTERGLFANVYSDEPNAVSEPHTHAGATIVTLEGSASIRLGHGEWRTCIPGDITAIQDDQLHEVKAGKNGWRYLFATSQKEARRQGLT